MAKKIDFKKVLLEKGERIGVGIAGGVCLLLLLGYLLWPGSGLLGESPSTNAETLKSKADSLSQRLNTATPSEADLPDKEKEKGPIKAFVFNQLNDSSSYRMGELFAVHTSIDASRRLPRLLLPVEGKAEVVMTQLRSYIFSRDGSQIAILEQSTDLKNKPVPNPLAKARAALLARLLGAGGGGLGGVNLGSDVGFQPPTTTGVDGSSAPAEMKTRYVAFSDLQQSGSTRLAETVRPLRQAIIVASFPYQAQIDEFMSQLRLPSPAAVLQEAAAVPDTASGQAVPAFRFLGVELQRMTVDAQGQPVPGASWTPIPLEQSFKPYVVLSGLRTEPSNAQLEAVSFDGLVMPRLLQIRSGQYPDLETKLPKIKDTLAALNSKQGQQFKPRDVFNADNFDIFKKTSAPATGEGAPGSIDPMGRPPFTPGTPVAGTPPMGIDGTGTLAEITPPEHCLIRVIDVTIRPGEIYKYRLRVRMANPNYKRQDVASPRYAEEPELSPEGWFDLPDLVTVPPEMHYYAVDQKELDGRDYKGMNAGRDPVRDRQTVLQIHRWLENVASNTRSFLPVGEWAVAERILVGRGEYIGRKERVEVPVWMENRESFIIPSRVERNRKIEGLVVDFSHPTSESILVDFQGGDNLTYERMPEGKEKVYVRDKARTELVIFSSDGKLLCKDSATDRADEERAERLKAWRDRVKEVKAGSKPTDPSNPAGSPFGTPTSPFGRP